ncbi:unnamed protein product [Owenia fusiformis]|uniref:Uncharacterized protein n=1 Tax=Owenia fusiformis TaxID=6347 RepID=A0A8J1UMT4_OWEFU|nr:unnamed protein product [Owenia fusiformis]
MATTSFQEDPFWMSKMKYQFEMLFGRDEKSGRGDPLCVQTTDMKRHLWGALHHNADDNKDKALSLSEWCSFWDDFAVQYNKRNYIPYWFKEFMAVTFYIMDKDGDELIDASDFASYYNETHKLPLDIVEAAFKKISAAFKKTSETAEFLRAATERKSKGPRKPARPSARKTTPKLFRPTLDEEPGIDPEQFKEMMIGFTVSKDMEHPGNILGEMMVNGRKV